MLYIRKQLLVTLFHPADHTNVATGTIIKRTVIHGIPIEKEEVAVNVTFSLLRDDRQTLYSFFKAESGCNVHHNSFITQRVSSCLRLLYRLQAAALGVHQIGILQKMSEEVERIIPIQCELVDLLQRSVN